MNDNPGGSPGGCVLWFIGLGIVLLIIGAVAGIGPFSSDKYHCYTQPIGINREVGMLRGLSLEEAQATYYDCYLTR